MVVFVFLLLSLLLALFGPSTSLYVVFSCLVGFGYVPRNSSALFVEVGPACPCASEFHVSGRPQQWRNDQRGGVML